jgi:hypothetical protein
MIDPLFSTVSLSMIGVDKVLVIRHAFTALLEELEATLPGGSREMSIIKTMLEQASFHAIKAVRNYKENLA